MTVESFVKAEETKPAAITESKFDNNLSRFRYICKDLPSPSIFIDYDFFFTIAACLARRVWLGEGKLFRLFPNLYIICVADPGIGKSVAAEAANFILSSLRIKELKNDLIVETPLVHLGPDAISHEKLIVRTAQSQETIRTKDPLEPLYQHSSITFCLADELGMLFTQDSKRTVSFLMKGWDCKSFAWDTFKHGEIIIKNSCINLLGCLTPDMLKDLMRQKLFDMGFIGRCLFLWGDKKTKECDKIETTKEQEVEQEHIKRHLVKLCKLPPSRIEMSEQATIWVKRWVKERDNERFNDNPRLKDYYARKLALLKKLAICAHFSDQISFVVEIEDLDVANRLLSLAEINMHKALCCGGENVLAEIAITIKEQINLKGPAKKKDLMLAFYHRTDRLEDVLNHLVDTGQVRTVLIDNVPGYAI